MAETFVLITPHHLFKLKDYLATRYEELGVKNARNVVGRIANLWFRASRVKKSLKDYEKYRREACQNLADSAIEGRPYRPCDRPDLLNDLKRARAQRDEYHYKANLFIDVNKLFAELPVLYITEQEMLAARSTMVDRMLGTYTRRKRTAHLKRKHQARRKKSQRR